MPDTLRKDLIDLVWSTVETYFGDRPELLARLGVENRSRQTEGGWLKEFIANAPADFAHMKCVVDRMTHSGWERSGSLAADQSTYDTDTDEFPVIRTARVTVTIRETLPGDDEDDENLGDEVVNALYAAGPTFGEDGDDLGVVGTGTPEVETRETRDNEPPQPGMVHTVTFQVTCQQWGRALRTAINTI